MIRSTGAMRIAQVVVVVVVIASLTEVLELHALNFILNQLLAVGLIAIVVLFQPELRRMIDHISSMRLQSLFGMEAPKQEIDGVITQTVMACDTMSRERVGALIVFARDNTLEEYFKTGTVIDGKVSEQLIRNIFFPKASLHDGAMIIRDGRVTAAGCVLPLSESNRLSADLGTRHRAGVGMSEVSDAVVVIVSEETGAISVAVGGMLKRHLAPRTLERLLRNELCPDDQTEEENVMLRLRQKIQSKKLHKKEKGDHSNAEK
jgi:diadenylate cyclase